jgi:hypothetical protein
MAIGFMVSVAAKPLLVDHWDDHNPTGNALNF